MSEFLCRSRGQSDLCAAHFFVQFKELGVRVTEKSALLLILLGMLKQNSFFCFGLAESQNIWRCKIIAFCV